MEPFEALLNGIAKTAGGGQRHRIQKTLTGGNETCTAQTRLLYINNYTLVYNL